LKQIKFITLSALMVVQPIFSQPMRETISFISANPFGFSDIIVHLNEQEEQEVFGYLSFPNEYKKDIYPLVIGLAGSLGWSEHHYEYLQMYREMGIATFELKSFKARGVSSTVGSQVDVTTAMMIFDAYRALRALSDHPKIDKGKVAITGWSLGGGTTFFSGWLPLKNAIEPELSFAAHLAFYPPCFVEPEILEFTDAPIHILIGELDNWTPAEPCVDLVQKMKNMGTDINLTIYENSHHSFDRSVAPIIDKNAYSFTDCRLKMRKDGAVMMNFLNIPMKSPLLQKIGLAFCAERGATFGGNPVSREKAFDYSRNFMSQHLLSN